MTTTIECRGRSRRGAALVLALVMMTTLTGMAMAMAYYSTTDLQQQQFRQREIQVQIASDDAANEAIYWMAQNFSTYVTTLSANPSVVTNATSGGVTNPVTLYHQVCLLSSSNLIDSTNMPSGAPAMFPATLTCNASAVNATGWKANYRDGCYVTVKIVCLTAATSYLICATAASGCDSSGNIVDGNNYTRRRVCAIVTESTANPFINDMTMYSVAGYTITGSAGTDSWPGDGSAYNPSSAGNATLGYDNGNIASGGTVTKGGSATVDGTITNNVQMGLPTYTYSVPSGATSLGAISSTKTLSGPGTYRATSISAATVFSGSGTINLYVDGPISTGSMTFAAGSTCKVQIFQNSFSSSLGSSSWDTTGGGVIGDVSYSGGKYYPNPERLLIISNEADTIKFAGNGMWAAVFYAPYSTIDMKGTFQYFGALLADSFNNKVNGTFNFHYDNQLANGGFNLPLNTGQTVTAWDDYNVSAGQQ